jgi:hypothetical protein
MKIKLCIRVRFNALVEFNNEYGYILDYIPKIDRYSFYLCRFNNVKRRMIKYCGKVLE